MFFVNIIMYVLKRAFGRHGLFCATHPWEIILAGLILLICGLSFGGSTQQDQWRRHASQQQNCFVTETSSCSSIPQKRVDVQNDDSELVVMTIIRSIGLLYGFHQMRTLKQMGTKDSLGLTVLFAVIAAYAFNSCRHLLHQEILEIREAILYFLLILDLPKACMLAKVALQNPGTHLVSANISKGLRLLGPTLTLDTVLELLVLSIGVLSGVQRLEILCSFASLSVIINYIVFTTFYPVTVCLLLQVGRGRETTEIPNTVEHIRSDVLLSSQSLLQRLKISIAVALVVILAYGRWPFLSTDSAIVGGTKGSETFARATSTSGGILSTETSSTLHGHNGTKEPDAYGYLLKWISVSLDQLVVLSLTAALAVRYFFFEENIDFSSSSSEELRKSVGTFPKEVPSVETNCLDSTSVTQSPTEESSYNFNTSQLDVSPTEEMPSARSPLMRSASKDKLPTLSVSMQHPNPPITFRIGESDSDSENDDIRRRSSVSVDTKGIQTMESSIRDMSLEHIKSARSVEECLVVYKSEDGAKCLSDEEVISLVDSKHIPAYQLEKAVDDMERGVSIRRKLVSRMDEKNGPSDTIPYKNYDYSLVQGACCENVIGYVPIPLGVIGPLKLDGKIYQVPMATTEGCLVASTNRGCRALQSGIRTRVVADGMSRAPVVRFPTCMKASEAMLWLNDSENYQLLKTSFDSSSRFARLQKIHCRVAGRYLFIRFVSLTGDAMGMNMISKGTEVALNVMHGVFPDMEILSLSGNVCTDKKPAAINWIEGRGKSVVSEAIVPADIVENVLKTTTAALVELNIAKNLVGSAVAGSIGGFNAHAANIVTAIYIATGQDPAQNIGSSNCMTLMEPCGVDGRDLHITCTMPSIEVGTVGGGTILPAQAGCLDMLGIRGAHSESPGENSRTLARVVCATVMAGELSLMAALAAGHLVRSHLKHNRSATNVDPNQSRGPSGPPSPSPSMVALAPPKVHDTLLTNAANSVKSMPKPNGLNKRGSLPHPIVNMDFLSVPECKQT